MDDLLVAHMTSGLLDPSTLGRGDSISSSHAQWQSCLNNMKRIDVQIKVTLLHQCA